MAGILKDPPPGFHADATPQARMRDAVDAQATGPGSDRVFGV